ncbi:hypothetical protein DB346_02105 [Verrucomicrobia bacterium LW23]|nr:hypothetical protein DB346_02105 [Verrucomicrobia bacterium LW23]
MAQRDTLIILGAALIIAFTSTVVAFRLDYQLQLHGIRTELKRLAQVGAGQMEGDLHQQITSPEQKGSETYKRAIRPLVNLHRSAPDIYYLYTAIAPDKGSDYHIILDTSNYADELKLAHKVEPSPIMEVYKNPQPAMIDSLKTGTTSATELYTDRFGTFISAFSPIRSSDGRIVAVVGVDMDVATVRDRLATSPAVWVVSVAMLVLVTVLAGAMWRASVRRTT